MIIAYIGVIGSGKDYRAEQKVKEGFVRIDFKDDLISMVSDLVGYDIRTEYEWFKQAIVGVRKPTNPLHEAMLLSEMKDYKTQLRGRDILQRMGTDVIRRRHPRYWADTWERKAQKIVLNGGSVVVADCRFENEVREIFCLSTEVKLIFCDYRSSRYDPSSDHPSERMSQSLLSLGLKDGEDITMDHFAKVFRELNSNAIIQDKAKV